MTVTVYIDGDLIAFKAAAANEKRSILVTFPDGKQKSYKTRTEFKADYKDTTLPEVKIEDVQTPSSLQFACATAKSMINKICQACNADEYFLVVSGDTNFRDDLPLPTKYKSNREDGLRPVYLKEVKQYLVSTHDGVVTQGYEADDYLAMQAYRGWKNKEMIIQATIDKDAYGCRGWLYNWDKMEAPVFIDGYGSLHMTADKKVKGEGTIWQLCQSVLGDTTDGYKPSDLLRRKAMFGDAGAFKLLSPTKGNTQGFEAVLAQYKQWYPKPVTYTAWNGKEYTKDAVDIWEMYLECARMLRWEGDKVNLRETLYRLGINYE